MHPPLPLTLTSARILCSVHTAAVLIVATSPINQYELFSINSFPLNASFFFFFFDLPAQRWLAALRNIAPFPGYILSYMSLPLFLHLFGCLRLFIRVFVFLSLCRSHHSLPFH